MQICWSIRGSQFIGGAGQRALPIRILTVGKKRLPGVQLLVDEYIAKLKSYCHVDDVQIRSNPKNARNAMAQVDDEDIAVINLITSNDWVVILDERGLDLSSEHLAELLGDAGNTLQDYHFALVDHMVMDNECENVQMCQSSCRRWY
ncbi:hypothetical protein ES332_A06G127100v1 [Gossypium tomentosum]|uniref:Uncharacterized protein n=1 Tax=Gossypium tomentosum TaxID=34277 RepID=A0A5D2Q2Y1_GOSTO|nr:hypothetical protein ES332_A06G127100v1 [Gossypium tomentosum]